MSNKALYIPFENFESIGGPSTFMRNLKEYFNQQGIEYQKKINYKSSIFFPVVFDLQSLDMIKKNNGKIIQRLDGIYYPSKHSDSYIEKNRDIKQIYLNYVDFVIFQSEYSKAQCFSMFGEKPNEQYALIVNGVNKKIFYPDLSKQEPISEFKLVTTGNFRNMDMLEPVIKALDISQNKVKFKLTVVGPIVNPDLEVFLERSYINYVGPKDMHEVADILRAADLFIYSHLNPPCPNSVIEAISCGLPVVGFNSGSMSELLCFSPDLLAYVSEDVFQKYEDFDSERLAEKINLALNNYQYYRNRALDHSNLYSFEDCGRKYVKIFNQLIANNNNFVDQIQNTIDDLIRRKIWRK